MTWDGSEYLSTFSVRDFKSSNPRNTLYFKMDSVNEWSFIIKSVPIEKVVCYSFTHRMPKRKLSTRRWAFIWPNNYTRMEVDIAKHTY